MNEASLIISVIPNLTEIGQPPFVTGINFNVRKTKVFTNQRR